MIPKVIYAVHPNEVISKTDGDVHYITFTILCKLYEVSPAECVNVESERFRLFGGETLIDLHPDYSGNYKLPEAK